MNSIQHIFIVIIVTTISIEVISQRADGFGIYDFDEGPVENPEITGLGTNFDYLYARRNREGNNYQNYYRHNSPPRLYTHRVYYATPRRQKSRNSENKSGRNRADLRAWTAQRPALKNPVLNDSQYNQGSTENRLKLANFNRRTAAPPISQENPYGNIPKSQSYEYSQELNLPYDPKTFDYFNSNNNARSSYGNGLTQKPSNGPPSYGETTRPGYGTFQEKEPTYRSITQSGYGNNYGSSNEQGYGATDSPYGGGQPTYGGDGFNYGQGYTSTSPPGYYTAATPPAVTPPPTWQGSPPPYYTLPPIQTDYYTVPTAGYTYPVTTPIPTTTTLSTTTQATTTTREPTTSTKVRTTTTTRTTTQTTTTPTTTTERTTTIPKTTSRKTTTTPSTTTTTKITITTTTPRKTTPSTTSTARRTTRPITTTRRTTTTTMPTTTRVRTTTTKRVPTTITTQLPLSQVTATATEMPFNPNRVYGKPHIICEEDGIVFSATTIFPFIGEVYAVGKENLPNCIKRYSGSSSKLKITLSFEDCGKIISAAREFEPKYTMEIGIRYRLGDGRIAQQLFQAQCHNQRIRYELDNIPRQIEEALEELAIIPIKLERKADMPDCHMRIVPEVEDAHGHHHYGPSNAEPVTGATIGQKLKVEFSLKPESDAYGFLVKNCKVTDGISGRQHLVIDEKGCSTDLNILGHPHYDTYHDLAIVHWHAFKVPDNSILSIKCDFHICSDIPDEQGISNCKLIPTPPFCPNIVTPSPNSILVELENNLINRRSVDTIQVEAHVCLTKNGVPDPNCAQEIQEEIAESSLSKKGDLCMNRVTWSLSLAFTILTFLVSVAILWRANYTAKKRKNIARSQSSCSESTRDILTSDTNQNTSKNQLYKAINDT